MSQTRSKRVTSTLGTLGVRPVLVATYVAKYRRAFRARLGSKYFLNMLKTFLKLGVSRTCDLYVSNKYHARYRRVEHASNAFGASFRHVSVRYMRVPIL